MTITRKIMYKRKKSQKMKSNLKHLQLRNLHKYTFEQKETVFEKNNPKLKRSFWLW